VPVVPADPGRDRRADLRADCTRCFALCCVVPAFAASADFAVTKPAGRACPNLGADDRCTIHADLRERGFPGCVAYDCFGAGQHLSQVTFGGRDPRADAATGPLLAAAYPAVRGLHELLRYVLEALALPAAASLHARLAAAAARLDRLAAGSARELAALDAEAARRDVDPLLRAAGQLARAAAPPPARRPSRKVRPGADLIGADLRGADLRATDLRGALLIGADLRAADLRVADLIGADLRGADLRGADLRGALFVTGPQLGAARGDAATRVPAALDRPAHWTVGARRSSRITLSAGTPPFG